MALLPLLFTLVLASRLCHSGILWPEEGLPAAAALQVLHGGMLYRDVWFDKPPLVAGVYLLWGAHTGWPLRLSGAAYVTAVCALAYLLASRKWGPREGALAAVLMAFFLTFGLPSAVMALAADLLLVLPHLAAVYLAFRGRPFWSGVAAGVGLLVNAKAVLVLCICALWQWRAAPWLLAGFAAPNLLWIGWLAAGGALEAYWRQVWQLGLLYAGHTFVENPWKTALERTAGWAWFHAALVLPALWCFHKERHPEGRRLAAWAVLSLAGVALGWRFFPRYYFLLLPPAVMAAARGLALVRPKTRAVLLLLLLAPLARFGPRYVSLAAGRSGNWSDTAMDRDSRAAARWIGKLAQPGDTLFVWGYRPDLFAYTRLPAATRFLESQPLSGVLADRHLFAQKAIPAPWVLEHRREVARSRPRFVVDGLGLYNPNLAITRFEDLRGWLAGYREVGRTQGAVLYLRAAP